MSRACRTTTSVDGVDGDPRLHDRQHLFVLRGVDHDDRGAGVVAVDEVVELCGDRPVRADGGVALGGDDRDDRLLALVAEVAGDPQRFQQAVDAGILRVAEPGVGDERSDGLPAGDRHRDVGSPADRSRAIDTDDQRRHTSTLCAPE